MAKEAMERKNNLPLDALPVCIIASSDFSQDSILEPVITKLVTYMKLLHLFDEKIWNKALWLNNIICRNQLADYI